MVVLICRSVANDPVSGVCVCVCVCARSGARLMVV